MDTLSEDEHDKVLFVREILDAIEKAQKNGLTNEFLSRLLKMQANDLYSEE